MPQSAGSTPGQAERVMFHKSHTWGKDLEIQSFQQQQSIILHTAYGEPAKDWRELPGSATREPRLGRRNTACPLPESKSSWGEEYIVPDSWQALLWILQNPGA